MSDDFDDFEEISKTKVLAPCTMRCVESKVRGTSTKRVATVTFRCGQLDHDVVEVLSAPRFSVSYSPSQRAFRVRADERGQFQLTKAPRSDDVFLLRFPHRDAKMPWVEERVPIDVDVNVTQRAVFLALPEPAKPVAATVELPAPAKLAALPPPVRNPQPAEGERPRLLVPEEVSGVTLTPSEAALLTMLSDGVRRSKGAVTLAMRQLGYPNVSVAAVLGRTRQKLDVDHTFSTDGQQVWLNSWEVDKLRDLVEGKAA